MKFTLESIVNKARAGRFKLAHGEVLTPIFMPVGTQGVLKGLDSNDITTHLKTNLILANTYHLYLRPGAEILRKINGIHNFANFKGNYLTDSGGFQAFSLRANAKPNEQGIAFKSHIDGSRHFFTPQSVLDMQYAINSDIMMILDDLVGLPASKDRLLDSIKRTSEWARQSIEYHREQKARHEVGNKIFAIMQGGIDYEMRKRSSEDLVAMDFDGYAIGGLAVGESSEAMYGCLDYACDFLPENKPRYLMGVGTPQNLLECIDRGVDMFDCVMPTRNARNASIFTHFGRLNIKNARFRADFSPLDSKCECFVCRDYTRAFLHHLFRANEITYHRLASIHNLHFYLNLVREARLAIINKTWESYKKKRLEEMDSNENL
ncbi:tRNA guanosine(34) transglycosylase Tgt [Helicobacter saguini]|uniref:Queuine tRNA-ribosyltransferase n=1 Tax=Helicobacter saguini TaxID=1548018 RepID=A0A347VSR7_9HELI|nr:tRNA guanosine(34) transglycosylase Tgt [Helicobacter saguini]MWV62390.1 tRNA guanosine(34) transglycosylase Tgt [Helicobacter saguini]MWV66938.1 tRNA guanosine(34) transglycosylase Tgt [Helicobacter saguini]MWV69286.1 tRNA guanosine(34) transglycosylase Tgt [Helicobacter saguini]MWV71158.1 tRNA guanosine(34) transglycosylase Tgt [Helicobacter saguini]TLD94951.1 tRNA guanosine(34) transglycosylase Tgt [Helicobacter saguini]